MAKIGLISLGWLGIAFMMEPMWPLGDLRWGIFALGSFSLAWLSDKNVPPKVDRVLSLAVIVSWIVAGALVVGLVAVPSLISWLGSS